MPSTGQGGIIIQDAAKSWTLGQVVSWSHQNLQIVQNQNVTHAILGKIFALKAYDAPKYWYMFCIVFSFVKPPKQTISWHVGPSVSLFVNWSIGRSPPNINVFFWIFIGIFVSFNSIKKVFKNVLKTVF